MTKKELEELVKEQSRQISDLISLVQNQKKEIVLVKESGGNKDWKPYHPVFPSPWSPTSPINPWVTFSTTADLRLDKDGNRIPSPITGGFTPLSNIGTRIDEGIV